MKLELVTPFGIKRSEEVYEVVLPTTSGEITVLPGHEPLVTILAPGAMVVRRSNTDPDDLTEAIAVSRGIVEIANDVVSILANEAEEGDEIIEQEAKSALERAQKMHAEAKDEIELENARQILQRQTTRLKVAELHRRRRKPRGTLPKQ